MPFSCYWPFKFIILYFLNLKFEKISPLIDELDTQLSAYKTHEERIKILSEQIIFALSSSNTVHSLKDIINLHSSTGI
jgi:hypothetical protein